MLGNASRSRPGGRIRLAVSALLATAAILAADPMAAYATGDAGPDNGLGNPSLRDPTTLTLTETLKALKTNKYTSVELVKAYLKRIDTFEPYYNAFTQMNPNALADAAASDERRKGSKQDVGPL